MSASYPTKIFLAMKSGNLCAFKDCRKSLTSDGEKSEPALIGEAAHIYGENFTGSFVGVCCHGVSGTALPSDKQSAEALIIRQKAYSEGFDFI